jgi:hypothetical protein
LLIVIIRNLKKRIVVLAVLVFLWISVFFLSHIIISNMPISKITIDDIFTFSFPLLITAERIYINQQYEETITVSSNIAKPEHQKFSTYISLKGKFTFEYPSIFALSEKDFPNSDILFHIDFNDNQGIIHGFVQVWHLPYSLKQFLDDSKANSTLQFKDFISKELDIDEKKGYLWDYTVLSDNDKKYYKGMEFFFKKKDNMYRISYFVPVKQWNKTNKSIFWNMVKSFKVY